MCAKRIRQSDIIGQQGVNLIERIVLEMSFLWHPTNLEAGIDGIIEVRDASTGDVTNSIIQVQSKATERPFAAETATAFEFTCDERDLDYWLNGNAPVILVCSRPSTSEAYWVSVKDYFADINRRRARKVTFRKQEDRFDKQCRDKLAALAIPRDSGVYLSPLPKRETLVSNLLSVTFPKHLFRSNTDFRVPTQLWRRLRDVTDDPVSTEWVLHEGAILSFHDLGQPPWTHVCKHASSKRGDTSAWASSPVESAQKVFVELLNRCLTEKLSRLGARWSRNRKCYFVEPTPDLSDLKFAKRGIFTAYYSKADPNRIAYYRHSALETQFYRHDHDWYVELTPTYYFTRDGYLLDAFYESRLAGIKRLERNSAVIGQVEMWAEFLCQQQQPDWFSPPYPFLKFGKLAEFDVGFGIFDDIWLAGREEDDSTEGWLFEL